MSKLTILAVILALAVVLTACGSDELEAVRAEATRTATALEATRTALDLQGQALALERKAARDRALDPFVMAMPWVILAVGLASFLYVGYRLLQVWEARARLVRRRPEEGEPVMLLDKDRFALPLRSSNVYADLARGVERSPLLAESADLQERATARQQAGNLALAGQAARVVAARSGHEPQTVIMLPDESRHEPAQLPSPSPVRVVEPAEVRGWLGDVEHALLPEVVEDGD
jgi:ElaB/YqjD/DUF883 family membrane-anchored ribosome-binding protein